MGNFLEQLGLGFFTEREDTVMGLLGYVAQEAKGISGYYGLPYLNHHLGNVQMVLRTEPRENGEGLAVSGFDTHVSGKAVWEVKLNGVIDRNDADLLEKRVLVTRADGSGGMAVVNLINADVLPSFLKEDVVKMQMVAFPEQITYFKDEQSYVEAQPKAKNGETFCLGDGTLFPNGFLHNRSPEMADADRDDDLDDLTSVRGTVKALHWGRFEMGDEGHNAFVCCTIDTEFGPLEIVHTEEDIAEECRDNIRIGATVSFFGTLCGDVAIYEYEHGIVQDEEHHLAAFRYVFSGHDPERVRRILSKDVQYFASYNQKEFHGPDAVIDRFRYIQAIDTKRYAHFATISAIDDGEETTEYTVGKRCLVLAEGEESNYVSIAFIDLDTDGNVVKLTTSINPRYHFAFDPQPEQADPLQDFDFPESAAEAMFARAKFHGIAAHEECLDEVLRDSAHTNHFASNVESMLNALPQDEEDTKEVLIKNLFGYLFAKAIEAKHVYDASPDTSLCEGLVSNLCPNDAWNGCIHSGCEDDVQAKLEEAFELGKQFYTDFSFYRARHPEEEYDSTLFHSLLLVQNLGARFAHRFLNTAHE